MSVNTLHGEDLVARARAWQNADGNQNADAKQIVNLLCREVDALQGLAEYLAKKLAGSYCELTALPGEANPNGPCQNRAVAIRWQDDFADYLCNEHAESVADKGAIVIKVRRRAASPR